MTDIFDIHIYFGKCLFGRELNHHWLDARKKKYPGLKGCLIPCKPFEYDYAAANVEVTKEKKEDQWLPILRVDPWRFEQAISLVRKSKSPILFLHPFEEQIYPTHHFFRQVVEEAIAKNMKIMLACGYLPFSHSAQILPLVKEFAKGTFILTHGGQINICGLHMEEAMNIFLECPNTFFETSGIYRNDYIERMIEKIGSERILFGSASPVYDFDFEIERIKSLKCKESVKEDILYNNAINLFASPQSLLLEK